VCGLLNATVACVLVEAAILAARNRLCWLVTFTSPDGRGAPADFARSLREIKAAGELADTMRRTAFAFSLHDSGAVHVHAVFIEPTASKTTLERVAWSAGLGHTHVRAIGATSHDARQIAAYITRELPILAASPRPHRLASFAPDWPTGGITEGRSIVFETMREQRALDRRR
jgi:hypothetical protein